MCGIIGFNFEDKNLMKKSLNSIYHRGPDDSGTYIDKNVSIGHRRLSIIDLSKSGRQPMSNKNKTIWISFNGEIYNYKELKKDLEKKYDFKSNTDTEVLIYLYEEHGMKFLSMINGMFALCIYDTKLKKLFLARDRAGIKPLYYYVLNKKFAFSSEIKAILQNPEIIRKINPNAINHYLTFRANTSHESIVKNIYKLKPGHYLTYNLINNKLFIKKYWDIHINSNKINLNENIKSLKNLLNDSVKSRLMSDVPYGAYLSGGVDSGTIVALMRKNTKQKVNTFSVGFDEDNSETKEARFLSDSLNTNHHELIINEKSIKVLPDLIYQSDEPMADPTSIPIYQLSKYAKKYCTVILTGEGADEIFAGYPQYKFMNLHSKFFSKIPKNVRTYIPSIYKSLPSVIQNTTFKFSSDLGEKGIERMKNFIISNKKNEQYFNQISIFNKSEQERILKTKYLIYDEYKTYFTQINKSNLLNNILLLEFKNPMVEDLLMKVDKNTMKYSIEGRVPFLDHRIVELAFNLPQHFKLNNLVKDKHILRKSVSSLLPKQTRVRKKRHFFVPINNWIKNDLSVIQDKYLSNNYLKEQGIFNPTYIDTIIKGFNKSKLYYARQLWNLITFQIWYYQYIENEKIKI